jgi:hypothetical protein
MKERPTKCIFKVNHIWYLEYQPCSYMFRHCRMGSTSYLHLFSTYDVAYAQFHQDTLGSLTMALLQRQNMKEQD